ncbi:response regulator [Cytophaga sp. FL35]|uniref:response regulator n=1 Tax=Cytophaga sp. FL35 TaxID=1904456 RepID=UPI00165367F9|nr:response regulator [Cytophaga sp. FL35]MBC6996977.1 response regulator [Cytophaga sp. FL35]
MENIVPTVNDKNMSILLVEDDEVTLFLAKLLMNKIGYINVDTCLNGLEASNYLKNHTPSLIFLDLNMPIMDGFELLEEMKTKDLCPTTKVVILTSSSRPDDRLRAVEFAHVVEFLEKPLSKEKLEDLMAVLNTTNAA